MKYGLYSMRDDLNGFMNLFVEKSDDMAKRGFLHAFATASKDSLFYTNPADYSLFKVGEWDTESGIISPLSVPEFLLSGIRKV